jgi:hypothetical protein
MKCPHCLALNCATDAVCFSCKSSLAPARRAAALEKVKAATPQWAYLFAALCGAIPVVTLGGAIPVVVGLGGAGACMTVSRTYSVPAALRFLVCLGITAVAWLILVAVIVELNPHAKASLYKMLHR